jgi:PEP-CTERM motif
MPTPDLAFWIDHSLELFMKLKFLAAAAALVCGMNSYAGINNGNNSLTGSGDDAEVFAMVWDELKGTYAIDFGITIKQFFALTSNTTLGTVAGSAAWNAYAAADGNLNDFSEFEGTRWGLFAVQGDGLAFFPDTLQYLTSSTFSRPIAIDNESAGAAAGSMTNFTGTLNQSGLGPDTALHGDTWNPVGTAAHYVEQVQIGSINARAGNAIGMSSSIYLCGVSGFDNFAPANCNASSSTVSFDGTSFNVTAVPEPGTYALLLAGLGTIGFAARRRLRG